MIRKISILAAFAAFAAFSGRAGAVDFDQTSPSASALLEGLPQPQPPIALESFAAPKAAVTEPPETRSDQFFTEPDDGRGPVLDVINGARQTITLTIYEIDDPQIVQALIAAKQRGVSVQVLYNLYSFTQSNPNAPTMSTLQQAGIEVEPAPKTFRVTHQKTLVADGRTAVIMSFNLRATYFKTSRDFGYVTSDPALVSEISEVFKADWSDEAVSVSEPALVWSPVNSREKITDVIAGAKRSLEIYNEELEDKSVLAAIAAAAGRGVQVRVLSPRLGNGAKDANQAGRDLLNSAGAEAKLGTGLYIHAKMVLADYGSASAKAYMGSENFSVTSLDKNRELGILLTDGTVLSSIERTFESDWAQTSAGAPKEPRKPRTRKPRAQEEASDLSFSLSN